MAVASVKTGLNNNLKLQIKYLKGLKRFLKIQILNVILKIFPIRLFNFFP